MRGRKNVAQLSELMALANWLGAAFVLFRNPAHWTGLGKTPGLCP